MNSLMYLTFTKIKGMIRNQFRSITSGLITIFTVLLYGGLVIMVFAGSKSYDPELMGLDANLALMAGIGMTALIMLLSLIHISFCV